MCHPKRTLSVDCWLLLRLSLPLADRFSPLVGVAPLARGCLPLFDRHRRLDISGSPNVMKHSCFVCGNDWVDVHVDHYNQQTIRRALGLHWNFVYMLVLSLSSNMRSCIGGEWWPAVGPKHRSSDAALVVSSAPAMCCRIQSQVGAEMWELSPHSSR